MARGLKSSGGLAARVAEHDWYHTLELSPSVVTPGWFDTRRVPDLVGLPESLEGLRCLDVGTFDGFWAFEMERRDAAEVVAIDLLDSAAWDWPATGSAGTAEKLADRKARGRGFELAKAVLGSSVERLELSVYDLDPERHGRFGFIYLGSLLLHLRDPIGALMRVRAVCEGELLIVDAVDPSLRTGWRSVAPAATLDGAGRPWWWKPNPAGLVRMAEAAGFEVSINPRRFNMPAGAAITGIAKPHASPFSHPRRWWYQRKSGDPHAALRCRPL